MRRLSHRSFNIYRWSICLGEKSRGTVFLEDWRHTVPINAKEITDLGKNTINWPWWSTFMHYHWLRYTFDLRWQLSWSMWSRFFKQDFHRPTHLNSRFRFDYKIGKCWLPSHFNTNTKWSHIWSWQQPNSWNWNGWHRTFPIEVIQLPCQT